MTTTFQVRRDQLPTTRLVHREAAALQDGQVRISIAQFALTSNNITYAAFGEAMHYWRFFPTDDAAWGCIPVWGFGTVSESRHPDVAVGERLYGYFPMASEAVLTPGKMSQLSFADAAPHRAELHAVYNQYNRCATDPFYTADSEGIQALLRPLFTTSWLIDDFMDDNRWFGANTVLLSSASSKTAYGTAFQMAKRTGIEVVGLTSDGNRAFCESLGCYSRVLGYQELDAVAADTPAIYVDFAGNAQLRRAVHTHLRQLAYSSAIGGTHVTALGGSRDLPGPPATLFFAPAQIKKRSQDWGAPVLGQQLLSAWQAFAARVGDAKGPWLQVRQHAGPEALQAVYAQMLSGGGDPRLGHMVSL